MQYRVFKIPCVGDNDAEEMLNHFLRAHRIVTVHKELVELPEGKSWCFCVEYIDGVEQRNSVSGKKNIDRIDYKEVLSEDDFAIFAKLRDQRKDIAQQEAVPVYTICTNEQLAQMAKNHLMTIADFKSISGFGDAKIQKYGQLFLKTINSEEQKTEAMP